MKAGYVSITLLLVATIAYARDDGRYAASPLKSWFNSLSSKIGPCCSDADGTAVSDADWEAVTGGHYRVRIPTSQGGKDVDWFPVPDDAVLTQPNLYGRTMVWPVYGYSGPYIRCFIPGSLS